MEIRNATITDLDALSAIESACFPAAEAASYDTIHARLKVFPKHFWLLEIDGKIVSFVNGMVANSRDLNDDMYADPTMHNTQGLWQMIFGVNTLPEYRKHGYAEALMRTAIKAARAEKRLGLVLTCKEHMIHFYAKLGFADEGLSESTHGGVVWHKMRLTF